MNSACTMFAFAVWLAFSCCSVSASAFFLNSIMQQFLASGIKNSAQNGISHAYNENGTCTHTKKTTRDLCEYVRNNNVCTFCFAAVDQYDAAAAAAAAGLKGGDLLCPITDTDTNHPERTTKIPNICLQSYAMFRTKFAIFVLA